jgi:uncharacterized protein YodC (DUF2158 family)
MEPVQEFKVGDVVMLKSGGPKMTVTEIANGMAGVAWFDEPVSGSPLFQLGEANFPVGTLDVPMMLPGTLNKYQDPGPKTRPAKEVIVPTAKRGMS